VKLQWSRKKTTRNFRRGGCARRSFTTRREGKKRGEMRAVRRYKEEREEEKKEISEKRRVGGKTTKPHLYKFFRARSKKPSDGTPCPYFLSAKKKKKGGGKTSPFPDPQWKEPSRCHTVENKLQLPSPPTAHHRKRGKRRGFVFKTPSSEIKKKKRSKFGRLRR